MEGAAKKTVTIKLTAEQKAQLKAKTKGNFVAATFTFPVEQVKPPKIKVICTLDRVTSPSQK